MYLHVVRTKEQVVEYGKLKWVLRDVAPSGICFGIPDRDYVQERETWSRTAVFVYLTFTPQPRKNIRQDFCTWQEPVVETTNVQFSFCQRCNSTKRPKKKKFVYKVEWKYTGLSFLQEAFRLEGPPCGEDRCRALQPVGAVT